MTPVQHATVKKELKKIREEMDEKTLSSALETVDWGKLALIFETQGTFLFLILEVKGRWKTPRLRLESPDASVMEWVSSLFECKVQYVKEKRRSHEKMYRVQTEKRPLVFKILQGIRPFVSGKTLEQVDKGLDYVENYKL